MPLEPDAEQLIDDNVDSLTQDTEYTVTTTPGSGWYGAVVGRSDQVIGDTAGAPVSLSLTPTTDDDTGYIKLEVSTGASATGSTEEGQYSMVTMLLVTRPQD